ncbi:MAG: NtaA/DmoA family FMN-dependent monooxygenase [Reyranellaceae bacterium]
MPKQMHLLCACVHSPINHIMCSWASEADRRLAGLGSFQHWIDLAKTLERGCFDGVFFADIPAAYDVYKGGPAETMRYGVVWPAHDPVALVGVMAAATERLGVITSLSVAGVPPYHLVRSVSTLDYLSGGRVGWNIVTGHSRAEHRALGAEQMPHDERYDRADEYLDICKGLWNGFPPDAILMDRENRHLVDPDRITPVKYSGKYMNCYAVPPVFPSPQGRPLLFQAGSSGRGRQFATRHSDVIFAMGVDLKTMKAAVDNQRLTERQQGMDRQIPLMFAVLPHVGGTEEEALRKRDELFRQIPAEAVLARYSGVYGVDFSEIDIDKPLAEAKTETSQGLMALALSMFKDTKLSIREAIAKTGQVGGMPSIAGAPEQIADQLETLWRGSGGHGFMVSPAINNDSMEDFVDHVIPILQKRGIFRTEYEGRTLRDNLLDA